MPLMSGEPPPRFEPPLVEADVVRGVDGPSSSASTLPLFGSAFGPFAGGGDGLRRAMAAAR